MLVLPLLVLALTFSTILAQEFNWESDHSKLRITIPESLNKFAGATGMKHSQALFGTPYYGGGKKLIGQLYYVTPGDTYDGCKSPGYDTGRLPTRDQDDDPSLHKIFLVDRGDCDFVEKMKMAQDNGASAVIIADNICQCEIYNKGINNDIGLTDKVYEQCTKLGEAAVSSKRIPPTSKCETTLPYMADDGRGGDVSIPSFLIDFVDAQPMKDCLEKKINSASIPLAGDSFVQQCSSQPVIVSLEWDLPVSEGKTAEWQLWSSSDSEALFKKSFADTAGRLEGKTSFTPHYFIWDGKKWGCHIGNICATQCTKGGYYCNPDPDHNLFRGVNGVDVVNENLREICVWQQVMQKQKQYLWWNYVKKFAERCHPGSTVDSSKFNEACSQAVHDSDVPELNWADTKKCFEDSWTNDGKNALLDHELELRRSLRILQLPTLVVNGVTLRGGVTPVSVLTALCAGSSSGKKPSFCICVERADSEKILDCINSKCGDGQKLCQSDYTCYAESEFDSKCNQVCPPTSPQYCDTLGRCVQDESACPSCNQDEKYCFLTGSCLPAGQECKQSTCPENSSFCSSLGRCIGAGVSCPCTEDPNKPRYCQLDGTCIAEDGKCEAPAGDGAGTSFFQVFLITLIVVAVAGMIGYFFWRRQKAMLHDDVRAILNSYMALEESDDGENRPARSNRRVDPSPSGNEPVSGSDAATYI